MHGGSNLISLIHSCKVLNIPFTLNILRIKLSYFFGYYCYYL